MSLTRIEVLAAGCDGDNLFGGGQAWPNGVDAGADEAPDGRGRGVREPAPRDDPAWKWAAMFRGASFGAPSVGRAPDLWWLGVERCDKLVGTRLCPWVRRWFP